MRHKTLTIMLTLLMNMAVSVVCAEEHEYVDLGLPSGTLWATCNVGATSPEGYGDYFAWGETSTKSTYNWSTYKYCNSSNTTMTKYCNNSSYGMVDDKTELELADDAAYVNWGPDWCMPSFTQFEELVNSNYTTTTWTKQNGVKGRKITSRANGNSIFLPAEGYIYGGLIGAGSYGNYWSRTLETSSPYNAYKLFFYSYEISPNYDVNRYFGHSIRPVRRSKDEDNIEDVSMDNGQNEMGNGIYDLSGREITKPTRGIYIKDGKKMIAK